MKKTSEFTVSILRLFNFLCQLTILQKSDVHRTASRSHVTSRITISFFWHPCGMSLWRIKKIKMKRFKNSMLGNFYRSEIAAAGGYSWLKINSVQIRTKLTIINMHKKKMLTAITRLRIVANTQRLYLDLLVRNQMGKAWGWLRWMTLTCTTNKIHLTAAIRSHIVRSLHTHTHVAFSCCAAQKLLTHNNIVN